jgi:tetratricopeptide (TPR) repeat protein
MEFRKDRQSELDELFDQLQRAKGPEDIEEAESAIWKLWMQSGSTLIDSMMQKGVHALSNHEYSEAIQYFSEIITLLPDYPEGWNKRATAYYLRGDFKKSLHDIGRVLSMENRHFGAISGKANICSEIQDYHGALSSLQRLKKLIPFQPQLDEQINELHTRLGIK